MTSESANHESDDTRTAKHERIAILGGTFDPVHCGHLESALELLHRLQLDAMHFMPCQVPALKSQPSATAAQRLDMLALALADYPKLHIDDRELRRDGISYAIDSLRQIRRHVGPSAIIYFVMGSDAFADFHRWRQWRSILAEVNLVVMQRAGQVELDTITHPELRALLSQAPPDRETASGTVRVVQLAPHDISSTAIRNMIKCGPSASKAWTSLVPSAVQHYIFENGLYQ